MKLNAVIVFCLFLTIAAIGSYLVARTSGTTLTNTFSSEFGFLVDPVAAYDADLKFSGPQENSFLPQLTQIVSGTVKDIVQENVPFKRDNVPADTNDSISRYLITITTGTAETQIKLLDSAQNITLRICSTDCPRFADYLNSNQTRGFVQIKPQEIKAGDQITLLKKILLGSLTSPQGLGETNFVLITRSK
jgi:hypothetical protein